MQKLNILWNKLRMKAVSSVINLFATQTNFDTKNTILLVGSARSGTTFLMESLNANNDFRIIFEPFNPTYTKEWKSFSARHYIQPENITEEKRQKIDHILRGKIKNNWVDQFNTKIKSNKRLIKSVRANLMLDYIEQAYPEIEIIYTYRKPTDVIASRLNLNFDPKDVFLVLEHQSFIDAYYSDVDIIKLKTLLKYPECCHAALWCFENKFVLESQKSRTLTVVKYEDMIGKTVSFSNSKIEISNKIRRPSLTSSLQQPYQISESEMQNINKVLSLFGITQETETSDHSM